MTEYITKEQAIDEVWDAFTSRDDPDLGRVIEENIERLPAADVAPVVHARWRYVGSNWECSCCLFPVPRKSSFYHWCPQCGARMDGDKS